MELDRFEMEIKRLEGLGEKELERWEGRTKALCRCPDCATYNECIAQSKDLLFCYLGKSRNCEIVARTCDCPVCAVTEELGLKYSFYCRLGSEKLMH
ncbi:MAG: DUF2769 domain-containing protein [Methanomassiliicoccus sp.]|nr:MAG: DUF2769 domain-containing protein [Methanomassiliicoccus sp.]